jgi:hypothetical protein
MPNTEPQPFFNVMPEAAYAKNGGRSVNASAADAVFGSPQANAGPKKTSITMDKIGSRFGFVKRKIFFIPAFIVFLALVGAGVWFLTKSSENPDDLIIDQPAINEPADPDVTTPGDWLERYFGTAVCTIKTQCGDTADPDRDGLTNKEEFEEGTDPNNPDSDGEGIADGDEKHIFGSEPLISRTFQSGQFNDADFVKGGFDINTNTQYTPDQLISIKLKVKERGLHQPTLTTIGAIALTIYDFQDTESQSLESMGFEVTPQAKLDRDTQRQSTIKKVGGALIKYKEAKKSYPLSASFIEMSDAISIYNTVATNYNDPINKEQYVYGYEASPAGTDFTLTYYSETQNQLIKYTAASAEETALKENAQVNNDQRIADLENIKSALMIYSSANADSNSNQINVFPTKDQYPAALIPRYISAVPTDPNGSAYSYEVTADFASFTLKAVFENPPKGVTGYVCNELECKNY